MRISIKPVDDMKILDNITNTVRDDLRVEIQKKTAGCPLRQPAFRCMPTKS